MIVVLVVQPPSYVQLFSTPSTAACKASLSSAISQSLLKFMFIASLILSYHLILCCPFLLLPSIFPSIRVFSSELSLCIRWPKYWSFTFSISPSNQYSELISLRIDWFDLPAVQGTLKSLLQHDNSNSSILFVLSLLYGPTLISIHDYWKNHIFGFWNFVGKMMSWLFYIGDVR